MALIKSGINTHNRVHGELANLIVFRLEIVLLFYDISSFRILINVMSGKVSLVSKEIIRPF
jgi:hypothetical protein